MRRFAPLALTLLAFAISGCGGTAKEVSGPVTGWGHKGVVSFPNFEAHRLLEDTQGRVIVLGVWRGSTAEVVRLEPDGSVDKSFGKRGFVFSPRSRQLGWLTGAVLPDGKIALAGTIGWGIIDDTSRLVVSVLDSNGRIDRSFAQDGYYSAPSSSCLRGPAGILSWRGKIVVTAARFCRTFRSPGSVVAIRLGLDGKPDRSFGRNGLLLVTKVPGHTYPETPMLATPKDHLLIATPASSSGHISIVSLHADGSHDIRFGERGVATASVSADPWTIHRYALFRGKEGGLYLTGCNYAGSFFARFNANGSPDLFWSTEGHHSGGINVERFGGAFGGTPVAACAQFALLPDGDFVVAGTILTRLEPRGVVDPAYPGLPVFGFGRSDIGDLLVSPDGTVLEMLLNYNATSGAVTTYLARYRQVKAS